MTVAELKELIQDLPDDMLVIMPVGENVFLAACYSQSDVRPVQFEKEEPEDMFVLIPCQCNDEPMGGSGLEINLN